MTSSRVRESLALQSKKERDVQRVKAEAALAAETAYLEADGFIAEAQSLKAAETSGEVSLESNQLGFEVGLRMSSDVLNAQHQLFTVRRDWIKAQVEALLATLRLKASVGALGEEEMGALNRWL
jgi:outer membrane protein